MANKKSVSAIAKMLVLTMGICSVVSPLMACNNDGNHTVTDPNETTPLTLASDVLDGVFNPFFYTSGSDGEVVGQTQVGMLSSDANGKPIANWNEPSVAFDFGIVTTGKESDVLPEGSGNDDQRYEKYYTDYYFAIKNNIKFSDGTPLTKDDVLFNIYMYLDPVYAGSSTMYSVNIRGLAAYRAQSEDATEAGATNEYFNKKTDTRINLLRNWADPNNNYTWDDLSDGEYDETNVLRSDLLKIHDFFKEEIASDWTRAMSVDVEKDYVQYKGEDGKGIFKHNYEAFLYSYNLITPTRKYRPNNEVGEDGKAYYYELVNDYCGPNHRDCGNDHSEETLKNFVYLKFFGEYGKNSEGALKSYKENLLNVISYYQTSSKYREYARADIMSKEFNTSEGLKVPEVSGIEIIQKSEIDYTDDKDNDAHKTRVLKDADGNTITADVLHIRINGVDPKAIQNFSFTVAPGHYYSQTWDKVNTGYGHSVPNPYFGVEFSNPNFMDSVRVIHVPLGAGPYRATAGDTDRVPAKDENSAFYNSSIAFLWRNEHFMLGAPKIKQLRFQVVNNNMLYNSIKTNQVHYASPSMDKETLKQLQNEDKDMLTYEQAPNLGYGYIGVSAKYVPNIWVRRAIMSALNPQLCVDYYGEGNAKILKRPMSQTLTDYYDEVAFSDYSDYHYYPYGSAVGDGSDLAEIEQLPIDQRSIKRKENAKERILYLLEQGGISSNDMDGNGVFMDPVSKKPLRYTFTIAGGSEDHPAYSMMQNAVDILNEVGFDVSLKQDSTALVLLASGALTVWAAAWSSSSDPDMYQVYHTQSTATSTLAWGYDAITTQSIYSTEREILERLDALIEEGRKTTVVNERKAIYIEAQNTLMELAVEFPTYQRKVYYVWRKGVFDESTMFTGQDVGTYQSPLSRIWEVKFAA